VSDTKRIGLEGDLYYNLNADADENVTSGWVRLAYVEDFNIDDDPGDLFYYDRYTLMPPKKGRSEITGTIGQVWINYSKTVLKLAKEMIPIAFKLEISEDGENLGETLYCKNVYWGSRSFRPGNLNETGDMTTSANFRCNSYHFVPVTSIPEEPEE